MVELTVIIKKNIGVGNYDFDYFKKYSKSSYQLQFYDMDEK